MAEIQFLGATGTVTGSKYVLEAGGGRLMIDCGLFQGLKDLRERNWSELLLSPASINWVALTHAHIDHTGYLPRLVRDGFDGPVYATNGTADLLKLMLPDSARIQEEDAEYANRKGFSKHRPALPLYTERDAYDALRLIKGLPYGGEVALGKSLKIRFHSAGHILGSSFVEATITERHSAPITVLFTGDMGRYDEPILNDPSALSRTDYLLIESTYGNRTHGDVDPKDRLAEIINAAHERGGKIIIPAFAVGRTQLLVYYLRELEEEGRIPVLPTAVDSPMATEATKLYVKHSEDHDEDMQAVTRRRRNPLATHDFALVRGINESKALNGRKGAGIIISASGMATGGRVLHHLKQYLPDEKNTVLLVGYQGAGTRGRRLQEGEREIKIHGELVPVNARVESIGGLSAHADSSEILRWLSNFKQPPKRTFVVHGEPEASDAMKEKIERAFGWDVVIPKYQETFELA